MDAVKDYLTPKTFETWKVCIMINKNQDMVFHYLKRYEHNLTFPAKTVHREAITSNSRSPREASLETSNFVYIVLGKERSHIFV